MNLAHFRASPRHLAGFFGVRGVTRFFAQRLSHFLACGLPRPRIVSFLLAGALGLAGAGILMGTVGPLLLIAGPRRGPGCLAQPRRRAEQIGFDLALASTIAATITPPLTAAGKAFVAVQVAALVGAVLITAFAALLAAVLVVLQVAASSAPGLWLGLRVAVSGVEARAAVLTARIV
jgi:hypothetical protein